MILEFAGSLMTKIVPHIVVVGSINMDLVIVCASLPTSGETVLAFGSREILGGEGANQAVEAARLGSRVSMIGRVGDDSSGQRLRRGHEDDSNDEAKLAAQCLVTCDVKYAIITMGDQGLVGCDGTSSQWFALFQVTAMDTTAAGDAFAAAIACRWCETDSIIDASTYGAAAGAIAASRVGAQPSLPNHSDIETLLQQVRI